MDADLLCCLMDDVLSWGPASLCMETSDLGGAFSLNSLSLANLPGVVPGWPDVGVLRRLVAPLLFRGSVGPAVVSEAVSDSCIL